MLTTAHKVRDLCTRAHLNELRSPIAGD